MGNSTPARARRLTVGVNYPCYRHFFGTYFGPDESVNPTQCAGVTPAIKAQWRAAFDQFAANCSEQGLRIARVFLLGNAWNYGTGSNTSFEPPTVVSTPTLHAASISAYRQDFVFMLETFRRNKVRMIPSFISFNAVSPFVPGTGMGGRQRLVIDDAARSLFLDDVLEPLLTISMGYRDVIVAWETMNEPVWPVLCDVARWSTSGLARWLGANWPVTPLVSTRAMTAFLNDAIARINRSGFTATTGHNFEPSFRILGNDWGDEATFPVQASARYVRQFHWYPDGVARTELSHFTPNMALIGEFSAWRAGGCPHDPPQNLAWPELNGADSSSNYDAVLLRLRRIEAQDYRIALLWPNQDHSTRSNLDADAERAVRDFLATP